MKPDEARRRRKAAEEREAAGREEFEKRLRGEGSDVVPDLIPTVEDRDAVERAARKLARQAEKQPRGSASRARKVDDLVAAIGRLVYCERVLALDPLERAALTPARLAQLMRVSEADLHARLRRMRGLGPEVEVVSR